MRRIDLTGLDPERLRQIEHRRAYAATHYAETHNTGPLDWGIVSYTDGGGRCPACGMRNDGSVLECDQCGTNLEI